MNTIIIGILGILVLIAGLWLAVQGRKISTNVNISHIRMMCEQACSRIDSENYETCAQAIAAANGAYCNTKIDNKLINCSDYTACQVITIEGLCTIRCS